MPSNKRFLGGLIGADPLRTKTEAVVGDSNWNDVTLLLDGSSTTDASGVGNDFTNSGATLNATPSPDHPYTVEPVAFGFPTGAGTATTQEYLYSSAGAFDDMDNGDPFTIEFWAKANALGSSTTYRGLFGIGGYSTSQGLTIRTAGTTLAWWVGGANYGVNHQVALNTTDWFHIALVYDGSVSTLFINGIPSSSTSSRAPNFGTNAVAVIGRNYGGSTGYHWNGQITDIRITKGIARYTSAFTPPTSALSADVSGITGSDDVVLLLDGSSDTTDASGTQTISETGNVTPVTATGHPYATSSLDFDTSTTSYLKTGTTNDFKFGTEPFTIEFWMKPDTLNTSASSGSYSTIMENESGSTYTGSWFVVNQFNGEIYFGVNSGVSSITTSGSGISTTSWSHVAIVRGSNNTCTIYVDGVSKGSATISQNLTDTNSRTLVIGKQLSVARRYDGQLTDIRITKGEALYPFHPPISAFPTPASVAGEAFQDPGNVDRTTANAGVLSLDTAGPEDATLTEYTLADYTAYSETQITASNNNTSDRFGCGCDISGDGTITVFGAPFEDWSTNTISASGAVYVYENGTEVAILRQASPAANDSLGFDVAISKDASTIVASAYAGDNSDGEIYVFEKPANGWANGTSSIILTHTPDQTGENLGITLAISDNGDTVVAGTRYGSTTSYSAEAFVFEKPSGGWASMTTETAKLSAASGAYDDKFSYGLSISGDGSVIAVGAPENNGGQTESGTVYLYDKPSGGWVDATETHLLSAPSRVAYEHFGQSCSLNEDGTLLVVGADGHSTNRGRVHVFEDSSGTWSHKALLTSTDTSSNQHVGTAVAVSRTGTTVAASAPGHNSDEGAIYVWMKPSAGWANGTNDFLLTAANGSAANNDELGGPAYGILESPSKLALDTDGGKVVTSSVNDDDTNVDSGSGFLFAATTTVPSSVSTTTKGSQWFWGGMRGRNAITADQAAVSGDTYWNDVEILIDGTSLTQEQSPDNLSITNSGTVLHSTVYKFNQGQALYGDAYDYVAVNDANLSPGTGDFTVEFWAKSSVAVGNEGLWSMHNHTNSAPSSTQLVSYLQAYQNRFILGLPTGGSSSVALSTLGVGYTNWNHFAIVRSSNTLQLFVNGKLGISTTDNTNITAPWQNFGHGYPGLGGGQYGFYGYMEQIRVTIGTARYYEPSGTVGTQTFTAPTAEFPQTASQAAASASFVDTGVISLPEYYQANTPS